MVLVEAERRLTGGRARFEQRDGAVWIVGIVDAAEVLHLLAEPIRVANVVDPVF